MAGFDLTCLYVDRGGVVNEVRLHSRMLPTHSYV